MKKRTSLLLCCVLLAAGGAARLAAFQANSQSKFTDGDASLTPAALLLHRFGIVTQPRQSEVDGKQLKAAILSTNWIVHSGERIALALDLEFKPAMHVYASGAKNYTAIEWKMNYSPLVKIHAPLYPKPQPFVSPDSNETVPVYTGRVRLIRDLTITSNESALEAAYMRSQFYVEGKLIYQACDDKMCYFPQELPVKWWFRYEPTRQK